MNARRITLATGVAIAVGLLAYSFAGKSEAEAAKERQSIEAQRTEAQSAEQKRMVERRAENRRMRDALNAATDDQVSRIVKDCQQKITDQIGKAAFSGVHFPAVDEKQFETVKAAKVGMGAKVATGLLHHSSTLETVRAYIRYLNSPYDDLAPEVFVVSAHLAESFSGMVTMLTLNTCSLSGLEVKTARKTDSLMLN